MSSLINDKDRPYWRSLAELEADPSADEMLANEFPENADQLTDPLSRRNFVQLMGASLAFAGVAGAGCKRWEKEKIEPLSRRPDDYVPGVPKKYATAMPINGAAESVIVTSFEGRPIKVDGNADHPLSGTGSSAFAQASVLNLYDPDRSRTVRRGDTASTWQEFEREFNAKFKEAVAARGKGIAILSESVGSPSLDQIKRDLSSLPDLKWYEWEPLSRDNERMGTQMAFGQASHAIANLDKCDVVLALDCDLLVEHPAALHHSKGFASRRRPTPSNPDMSRLYAVESAFSSTGAVADHRLPLRSELILPFLMAVDAKVNGTAAPASKFLADKKVAAFVDSIAEELKTHNGSAAVMVGHRQPAEVHALAARLNFDIGATSANPREVAAVSYIPDLSPDRETHLDSIRECVNAMNAGGIDTLIILGGNPVYDAPADLGFGDALAKVKNSIHLSLYDDETSEKCSWHLPRAHYLEAWGDHLSYDNTWTLQQPIIEPMYGGKSELDLIVMLLPLKGGLTIVRSTFDSVAVRFARDTEKAWRAALHTGFINLGQPLIPPLPIGSRPNVDNPTLTVGQLGEVAGGGTVEVVFTQSPHSFDGRFANNAWLQETPDFMTKLVWDNAALISPRTADDLGISHGDMITVSAGGRTLEIAAYVMAGQAPYSIAVSLGHGRKRAGRVGGMTYASAAMSGFDSYALRGSDGLYIVPGATIKKSGGTYTLASTVDHWQMDAIGRKGLDKRLPQLVREGTLDEYKAKPNFATHGPNAPHYWQHGSLWKEHEYTNYKWGMAIDLNTCTGCNACTVACQAENNIPVVGKEQVTKSREMHWLRIDRYFKGDKNDPQVVHQPVTCMQCENAPCEQVCPVGATVHSSEGLNDMVYNRCVGTRYCLNNCPYRVRRFNFLDWHKHLGQPENQVRKLLFNPEVTVRSRGVMEKCTFCVQRIRAVTVPLRNAEVKDGTVPELEDGAIQTACQEACPTDAIVFGDLNNPKHRVAQLQDDKQTPRNYQMLSEYQIKPRTRFLARIRNPNPQLVARLKA